VTVTRVPVIAVTGHLGAGKTTVVNHLLRRPGARVGVVVNDFGEINIDAGLVVGQIDEPASIAGGCICCAVDDDGLDTALQRLSRMIRFSGAEHVRPGGVIDVIDAVHHFGTVDLGGPVPRRYAASDQDDPDQLPLRTLLLQEHPDDHPDACADHRHVTAVTVSSSGAVGPGRVIDLLEDPPPGVYRVKGTVTVRARTYLVDLVGHCVHVRTGPPPGDATNRVVAIGPDLDAATVRHRLERALEPAGTIAAAGLRRLHRHRRLSR
jgi:G3E family GTPase